MLSLLCIKTTMGSFGWKVYYLIFLVIYVVYRKKYPVKPVTYYFNQMNTLLSTGTEEYISLDKALNCLLCIVSVFGIVINTRIEQDFSPKREKLQFRIKDHSNWP